MYYKRTALIYVCGSSFGVHFKFNAFNIIYVANPCLNIPQHLLDIEIFQIVTFTIQAKFKSSNPIIQVFLKALAYVIMCLGA